VDGIRNLLAFVCEMNSSSTSLCLEISFCR
jgi:hypothetical protein